MPDIPGKDTSVHARTLLVSFMSHPCLHDLPAIWLQDGLQRKEHTQTHTDLAYGGVGVTGGRMPAALALNAAAHSGGGGRPGRWSRCQGAGMEAVKTCSAFLITQGDTYRRVRDRERRTITDNRTDQNN